jgi:hypothetical protein
MSKYHVTTKRTKETKDSEIIVFQFSSFVLFATFVVKYLFRFWFAALPRWVLRGEFSSLG